jgi:hypothetical protein
VGRWEACTRVDETVVEGGGVACYYGPEPFPIADSWIGSFLFAYCDQSLDFLSPQPENCVCGVFIGTPSFRGGNPELCASCRFRALDELGNWDVEYDCTSIATSACVSKSSGVCFSNVPFGLQGGLPPFNASTTELQFNPFLEMLSAEERGFSEVAVNGAVPNGDSVHLESNDFHSIQNAASDRSPLNNNGMSRVEL